MSEPFGPSGSTRPDPARVAARALSFGHDAAGYDEARPSYPAALVDDLLPGAELPDVLDVGCGTGKAARLLSARGARVLGVEADERMAAVARAHGVEVEVARFEDWVPDGRRFGLVTAGQAWHWVDPRLGPPKAAELLEEGGRLALFWNLRAQLPAEVAAALEACYRRLAPELAATTGATGGSSDARGLESHLERVTESGRFEGGEARRYRWSCTYDAAAWRALLATHSDHRLLEPDRRERLLDALAGAVAELGGRLEVAYVTLALFARRR